MLGKPHYVQCLCGGFAFRNLFTVSSKLVSRWLCSFEWSYKHADLSPLTSVLYTGTSRAAGVPPAGYGTLSVLQTPFAESGPVQVDSKPNVPGSTVWGQHVNVEAEPSGRHACSLYGMQAAAN